MKESFVKKAVTDYANWRDRRYGDLWIFPNPTTGIFDPSKKMFRKAPGSIGKSDFLGIYKGRPIAIETKTPAEKRFFLKVISEPLPFMMEWKAKTNNLTDKEKKIWRIFKQYEFLRKVTARGGLAILADSLTDVETGLLKFDKGELRGKVYF